MESGDGGSGVEARGSLFARFGPEAVIFLFFAAMAVFMTWPMILRMTTSTYGFASDNQGVMWMWWWARNAGDFGAKASFCPLIGFPFGVPLNVFLFEPVADLTERFLLLFGNEVFVYNLELLASFLLSGVTMYYLVRHITGDRRAALFGGFAYMACVFHAYNSMIFIHLAMTQWMPLFIMTLLLFIEKPSWRNAIWLAVAGLLVGGTSVHYAFFMWIFTVTFLVGRFAYLRWHTWRITRQDPSVRREPVVFNRRTALLGLGVVVVVTALTVPFYFKGFSNLEQTGQWQTRLTPGAVRNVETAVAGSAKAYDYVLPNKENFLLGGITNSIAGDTINSFENSLYLGWVVILLSVFALVVMLGQGHRESREARAGALAPTEPPEGEPEVEAPPSDAHGARPLSLEPPAGVKRRPAGRTDTTFGTAGQRALGWGLIVSAAAAFILSLPPYIHLGSARVPMPSMAFQFIAPWLRWYQRFGIVVLLCLVILGSMGVASLLSRLKRVPWEAVLVALLALSFLETTLVPPFKTFDFSKTPDVYQRIAEFPDDAGTVIYPAFEPGFFASARYMLYQRDFRKPMLNGASENTDGEALRRTVYSPFNPATPGILSRFGIDHVVYLGEMFRKYEGTEATSEAEVAFLPPGLRMDERIKSDDDYSDAYIFEVTAPEADFVPIYLGDITVPHIDKGRRTVRLMESEGIIEILNFTEEDAHVSLSLPMTNMAFAHDIRLVSGGKTLWQGRLEDAQETTATVPDMPVPADGARLEILVDGPALELSPGEAFVFGTNDASLKIGDLAIEPL
ncbi:MAG: hypothetical protein KKF41_07575 [Actinobacteria bacterium]|nr:hypothetical protein [Actinomycetota bacterium]MBU1942222.1 hypothetical protein [Actinomycetota bacterium]MBU2687429.1 hypothetical protein [Actinomycetota bacterium]